MLIIELVSNSINNIILLVKEILYLVTSSFYL